VGEDVVAVTIRALTTEDGPACDAIIASLPYHFGDAGGRASCARAVRAGPGLVACTGDDTAIGFLTWRTWYATSAEVTWMAVHAEWRRRGVGRDLLATLIDGLPADVRHLVVTTLSQNTPEDEAEDTYAGTRRFYQQNGFEPIWEPEGWWNATNQAVVMVRNLP
jgi:ribosomal protein S18 acetylase RimI-like enzyme